jgi:ketosteroid isomerase-like protein
MSTAMSRRNLVGVGAAALAGAALAPAVASAGAGMNGMSKNEMIVRDYYKGWEKKDWASFATLLADDFTFSSAAGDHLVGKAVFKKECWDTQIDFIKSFDLELVTAADDKVVVQYLCHTVNGKSFRNVEVSQLTSAKIESINCYFGSASSFPSAVSSQKG